MKTICLRTQRQRVLILLVVAATPIAAACASNSAGSTTTLRSEATTTGASIASTTASKSLTQADLAWLDSVDKLAKQMDDAFSSIPSYLTPTVLAESAAKLRACSTTLAKMGHPSTLLEPVYTLVKTACDAYDAGAQCFATAARVGVPTQGTSQERKRDQAIDCAYAASGKGLVPLQDALAKGQEIEA